MALPKRASPLRSFTGDQFRPPHALLTKYASAGAYTDCFATEIARTVSHAEFVEAFYTGGLFKVERFLLRVFISKPSTDLQAR